MEEIKKVFLYLEEKLGEDLVRYLELKEFLYVEKKNQWFDEVLKDLKKKAFRNDLLSLWAYYKNQYNEEESMESPSKPFLEELKYKKIVVNMFIAEQCAQENSWFYSDYNERWINPNKEYKRTPREEKEYKREMLAYRRAEKKRAEKKELDLKKKKVMSEYVIRKKTNND